MTSPSSRKRRPAGCRFLLEELAGWHTREDGGMEAQRVRRWLGVYLLLVAAGTLVFAWKVLRVAHPWVVGEWLISYAGGFVRRGLAGTLLLGLARGLHVPVLLVTGCAVLGLYLAWYGTVWRLLDGVRWSGMLLALVLSPATLAFTVLDPPSSVRKEVVLFLLLGGVCLLARSGRWRWAGLLVAAGAPAVVLVHEGLAVFLPYLAGAFGAAPRRSGRWLGLAAVLSGVALTAAVRHPGAGAANAVCAAVVRALPARMGERAWEPKGVCGGAIAYLRMTPGEARAQVGRSVRVYRYWRVYVPRAVLAWLPGVWLLVRAIRAGGVRRREALWMAGSAGLSALLSVMLFAVARDWGRWIEIHATLLLLLLLLLEQRRGTEAAVPAVRRRGAWLALAMYAGCWTLPAVGIFPGRWGYFDLVRYLHGYGRRPALFGEGRDATAGVEPASEGYRLQC